MEGAKQMKLVKELFLTFSFDEGYAASELVLNQKPRHGRVSVFAGKDFMVGYTYLGEPFELSLQEYKNKAFKGYWLNPENKELFLMDKSIQGDILTLNPLSKRDWVFVLVEAGNDKFKIM